MDERIKFPEDFQIDPALFYDAIVRSTDDYVYIVDMATDVALVSENMQRDFGLPGRLVKGLIPLWGDLIHDRDKGRYYDSIDQMLQGVTQEHNVEYQVRKQNDEYIWVVCRGRLQLNEQGKATMFAGVVTDLSNRGKVDYVTGLFVQTECKSAVEMLLERGEAKSGILLLGLDNFSNINGLRGHDFGNAVLRQFAQNVLRILPAEASLYRFDGDGFAIVYRNASRQDLNNLFLQIAGYARLKHVADGKAYYCTVSGGIAMIGQDGFNYAELLQCASSALEASKKRGKDTCTNYAPEINQGKLRSLQILEQIRNCIINDMEGFSLVYQPITQATDMSVIEAEALLRWTSKTLGFISPEEFIPLLENSGLIIQVGKWVMEQAVAQCKKWLVYNPDFVLNINCSYLQMLDEKFVEFVTDTIKKYDLDPRHVVLELTESRFVTDQDKLKETFDRLRQLKVRLAMDDFGTGYSSLGSLASTPADIVKIDRAFITAISDDEHSFNRSFIGAVIRLCHSVGISVCVEGVEKGAELDAVRTLNADSIQGFYISKPIPADEFERRYWKKGNMEK